jgi:hypothetical protein
VGKDRQGRERRREALKWVLKWGSIIINKENVKKPVESKDICNSDKYNGSGVAAEPLMQIRVV